MSALIWDSTAQAFKEAEPPKVYSGGVWTDSEGKIWDSSANAWKDAWSNGIILFDNGWLNTDLLGGVFKSEQFELTANVIRGYYTNQGAKFMMFSKPLDVAGYEMHALLKTNKGSDSGLAIFVQPDTTGSWNGNASITLQNTTDTQEVVWSSSKMTSGVPSSNGYLYLSHWVNISGIIIDIYKLWLEKE